MPTIYYTYWDSPVGRLLLAANGSGLKEIGFETGKQARRARPGWARSEEPFGEVIRQLSEYFAGKRREFDLVLSPEGTPFQTAVWDKLQEIPYGRTASYRDIAKAIGKPHAMRAVGAANGRNPIPIVIPCHRVIGSDGRLTGYGGGLDVKQKLLAIESQRRLPFEKGDSAPHRNRRG